MNILGQSAMALMSKMDMFHILGVIQGQDAPTHDEIVQMERLQRLLETPVAGELMWKHATRMAEDKGWGDASLAIINSAISRFNLGDPAESLGVALPNVVAILGHITQNAEVHRFAAVTQCPQCQFVYGVPK